MGGGGGGGGVGAVGALLQAPPNAVKIRLVTNTERMAQYFSDGMDLN